MKKFEGLHLSNTALGGLAFILFGLIVNYIFRDVFHSIPIEKLILGSDPEGYFQYLPNFFLRDWSNFEHLPWAIPFGEGKTMSVFTCGVAILWAPFFVLAHFISVFFNLDADGYGNMYYGFVLIAALFYVYVGLAFLHRLLNEFFKASTSLKAVAFLFFGTNIFYYTMILGAGMSHAYSFAMISIYVYFTHRFFRTPTARMAIFMALPLAMAILIRPTNIIASLYFFGFGIKNTATIKERIQFWLTHYKSLIWMIGAALLVAIPQMAYWYKVSGSPIVYSYQNYGFPYWAAPKIGIVLFGKYNGWFSYTPAVLIALFGLFASLRKAPYNNVVVSAIFVLALYINASWWAPTFSAACGQRAMIDFLPFLTLPLAWFIDKVNEKPAYLKWIFGISVAIIVFYNIQFAFRYDPVQWWDTPMSWEKFWKTMKF